MKTIPTLLTTTTSEFIEQMGIFQRHFHRIQLDIADGDLVPNVTTQIDEIVQLVTEHKVDISPATIFDFHLMIRNYEPELNKIVKLQEQNVQVNVVLINAENKVNVGELNNSYSFSIGLDTFPGMTIDNLARQYDLDYIPSIQIMTVNPGFQGSPFQPLMLNKIQHLRDQDYKGEILIDGGVNNITIPVINVQKTKPDFICIGSYLTKAGNDLDYRVNELRRLE